jgi:nicotinate-nucleotide pyrophosphorylase (carboxylating)
MCVGDMNLNFSEPDRTSAEKLIDLALAEDLHEIGDLTCQALIGETERAAVQVVARQAGVLAGTPVAEMVFARLDDAVKWETHLPDGSRLEPGSVAATVSGPLRALLTGERTALNFLTHLSGVATLTQKFVDAVAETNAKILDTRKTHPGYRLLEKYAVRAGGGTNHRMGLYDGVLIKDNYLAAWAESGEKSTIAEAIKQARNSVRKEGISIEVEVDTLEQLADALNGSPDIVLLDNMIVEMLRKTVVLRNEEAPNVLLEASGNVRLENVVDIAKIGVERISVGALTHSAVALDLAFDWKTRIR